MKADRQKRPVPAGAKLLREYLVARRLSVARFALANGLDASHVRHILHGRRRRLSVDIAIGLEAATRGGVPVHSWGTAHHYSPSHPLRRRGVR